MRKVLFIDKDGTLLKDVSYNADPSKIEFNEGAAESLQSIRDLGFEFIVITNQPGIALGYFNEEKVAGIKRRIADIMLQHDLELLDLYYCPHLPNATVQQYATVCNCRKPKPRMLLKAAFDHQIDLNESWMVGDILDDVEAGKSAGCRGVLLDNGNETEWLITETRSPDHTIKNWWDLPPIIKQSLSYHNEGRMVDLQKSALRKGGQSG